MCFMEPLGAKRSIEHRHRSEAEVHRSAPVKVVLLHSIVCIDCDLYVSVIQILYHTKCFTLRLRVFQIENFNHF